MMLTRLDPDVQRYQLVTTDLRANTHILFASNIFQKSAPRRRGLRRIVGEGVAEPNILSRVCPLTVSENAGLLWTEGTQHRDQVHS